MALFIDTFHRAGTNGLAIDNASNQSEAGYNNIPTDCKSVYSGTSENDYGEIFCKSFTSDRREVAFEGIYDFSDL